MKVISGMKIAKYAGFGGEQSIKFAISSLKNITLIHALNGCGKSSLIDAFFYCLYGRDAFVPQFELPTAGRTNGYAELGAQSFVELTLSDGFFETKIRREVGRTGREQIDQPTIEFFDDRAFGYKQLNGGSAQNFVETLFPEDVSMPLARLSSFKPKCRFLRIWI